MNWKPIETYKVGQALFYCPPIINSRHGSNNTPEYYTFDRPLHRPPTHWCEVTPPTEEQFAENANCSEYGKKHTDGSRSGGQPPNPADVMLPCPFCGQQCAQLVIDQGDKWAHYEPSCLEVRTSYNVSEDAPWRAAVIAAWNTRRKATQREENLATALRVTAGACADQVNTIVQLRAEIAAYQQAQPTVSVTDAMVERAVKVLFSLYQRNTLPAWDKRIMRQTLEAVLEVNNG